MALIKLALAVLALLQLQSSGEKQPIAEKQDQGQWDDFLVQLADPDVSYVRCPSGEWRISRSILIRRSNVTVDFDGSTIIPVNGLFMPIRVASDVESKEWHATGDITADTQSLSLDPSDFLEVTPGDLHQVRPGVNFSDPNESQYSALRVVRAIDGNSIRYDRPFGIAVTKFESFERLAALSGYPEKVGPWGPGSGVYGSQWKRGLGNDHGVKRVVLPVSRVTLLHPRIVYPDGSRLYGAWGISLSYCTDCLILNAEIENPCGSAVHLDWCRDCVVSGLSLSGVGGGNPWIHQEPPRRTSAAIAVSAWGAENCVINRVDLSSANTALVNFEAGSGNVSIRNCSISTQWMPGIASSPQFGLYGPGRVRVENVSILMAPQSSSVFPGWLADAEFHGLDFRLLAMPDFLSWTNFGRHVGPMQWGEMSFGAAEDVEFTFVPTKDGFPIPYPEGVLLNAEYHLTSWVGVRHVNVVNNYLPSDSLVVRVDPKAFEIGMGVTYVKYRQNLAAHRVWIQPGVTVQPITVRCQMMRRVQ